MPVHSHGPHRSGVQFSVLDRMPEMIRTEHDTRRQHVEKQQPALPICVQCERHPVKRGGKQYCSRACAVDARRKPPHLCACGQPRHRQSQQCRACAAPKQREILAAATAKALIVNRERYAARLRARLSGVDKKSALWRKAYQAGFQACWQGLMRKVQRGDIILVNERKVTSDWRATRAKAKGEAA